MLWQTSFDALVTSSSTSLEQVQRFVVCHNAHQYAVLKYGKYKPLKTQKQYVLEILKFELHVCRHIYSRHRKLVLTPI